MRSRTPLVMSVLLFLMLANSNHAVIVGSSVFGSGSYDMAPLDFDTVVINGDSQLEQWIDDMGFSGSGTEADPYVARGLSVDAGINRSCIDLKGTSSHLRIADSVFFNASKEDPPHTSRYGAYVHSCENIEFVNCTFQDCYVAISIQNSRRVNFSGCNLKEIHSTGLSVYGWENSMIEYTNISSSIVGISLNYASWIRMDQCLITNASDKSIYHSKCDNVSMQGLVVSGPGAIELNLADNVNYSNSSLIDNEMILFMCKGVNISDNNMGATILRMNEIGSHTLWNNTFGSGGIKITGIKVDFDRLEISSNNTVLGLPVLYSHDIDMENQTLETDHGQYILANVSNFRIRGLNMDGIRYPITLFSSSHGSIERCSMVSSVEMVYASECSDLEISGNTLEHASDRSISFVRSSGCTAEDNIVESASVGIIIGYYSKDISVLNNTIYNCSSYGIMTAGWTTGALVSNNIIEENHIGLYIEGDYGEDNRYISNIMGNSTTAGITSFADSGSYYFFNNQISDSGEYGIRLRYSDGNSFVGNRIEGSGICSVMLDESENCEFHENQLFGSGFIIKRLFQDGEHIISPNNTVNGLPIYYYTGDAEGWTVPEGTGQVLVDGCYNLKVEGVSFDNISYPVAACRGVNLEVRDCSFTDFGECGIYLNNPQITNINYNNITRGKTGIDIESVHSSFSNAVDLLGNNITDCFSEAVHIYRTDRFSAESNRILDCASGFYMYQCDNCSFRDNLVSGSREEAFYFIDNDYNRLTENTVYRCGRGIREERGTHKNVLTFNMFRECLGPAVEMDESCYGDRLYNNAFILNNRTDGTFDEGKPQVADRSGKGRWFHPDGTGNHWHDLRVPDGDDDGIVDEPYRIAENLTDEYPIADMHLEIASAPTSPRAIGKKGHVILSWQPPERTRGMQVEEYIIEKTMQGSEDPDLLPVPGHSTTYNDTDVVDDVAHTYRIRASTELGKGPLTGPLTAVPDATAPRMNIISPGNGEVLNKTTVDLCWEADDPKNGSGIAGMRLILDGDVEYDVLGMSCLSLKNMTPGPHVVVVHLFDNVGNARSVETNFTVDLDPPTAQFDMPLNGSYLNEEDIVLSWSGSDQTTKVHNYSISMDHGPWIDIGGNTTFEVQDLVEGWHSARLAVRDPGGNYNMTGIDFLIDTRSPEIVLNYPRNGSYARTDTVLINWTAADAMSGIERISLHIDGEPIIEDLVQEEFYTDPLDDGVHNISIHATDLAGNMAVKWAVITVDTVNPKIVDHGPVGEDVPADAEIFALFSEEMDWNTVTLTLEDVPVTIEREGKMVQYYPPSPLKYGVQYEVSVTGTDISGNPLTHEWTFDTDRIGTVRGMITDGSGEPVEGVSIMIAGEEMTTTGIHGSFSFEIREGIHTIEISSQGYQETSVDVEVEAGKVSDVGQLTIISMTEVREEGSEEEKGIPWIPLLIMIIALIITILIVLLVISRRSKGSDDVPDVFRKADHLRDEAQSSGMDISSLDADYRNALYQRDIGDLEDSVHSMETYINSLEGLMEGPEE